MSIDSLHTVVAAYYDDIVECDDMPDASDHPKNTGHDDFDLETAVQLHLRWKSVIV